jgi:HEAT repeat protein
MSQILNWLAGGDLRSDGSSNQVADFVLANLHLLDELMVGLRVEDDLIRGRTADALEKIARHHPNQFLPYLIELIQSAKSDPVPMVRFHLVMILGHLSMFDDRVNDITEALLELIQDESVFTRSWAIVSLCIVVRQHPERGEEILGAVAKFRNDPSAAIRAKVRYAMPLLANSDQPFPKGWIKSDHLQNL